MLIGFMAAENELSLAFIVAVFLANFPEAMSASGNHDNPGAARRSAWSAWSAWFCMQRSSLRSPPNPLLRTCTNVVTFSSQYYVHHHLTTAPTLANRSADAT